ncbi:MAG TPA: polymer-forming cytoskeletal protein [Gemmatimonadaceae bacterium]|nr:polymer-forming cytoskeletal protein [Gemmatimonadaceae bacterium]
MKWFARRSAPPVSDGYSLVDERLAVAGNLETNGTVRVEGAVEGTLHRVGRLIIGASATVLGDIDAHEVVVAGTLVGDLRVRGRIQVKSTATVRGDIHAATVVLEDGGTVHGHLLVQSLEAAEADAPQRPMLTPSRGAPALSPG